MELVMVWFLDKIEVIYLENFNKCQSYQEIDYNIYSVEYLVNVIGDLVYVKYLD